MATPIPRLLEPPGGLGVDDSELDEDEGHPPGDGLVGDRGDVLGTPEDVHDVHPDVRRDLRERGRQGAGRGSLHGPG